jgi:hypothetical protein
VISCYYTTCGRRFVTCCGLKYPKYYQRLGILPLNPGESAKSGGMWKGRHIEHFDPDFAQTDAGKGKAWILAARCKHLEAMGKDVNKANVVLKWGERVKQAAGEGRGRS